MGQKVSPTGFRLGITTDHRSRWFADSTKKGQRYSDFVKEDVEIRRLMEQHLERAGIAKIDIERTRDRVRVDLHTARPGIVIGRRGAEADRLRAQLEKLTEKQVQLNILEVKNPEINAQLVAQGIAEQLAARVSFRRAMRKGMQSALRSGALGIRVQCSGRLGGAEMSRSEFYREGRVPLHTLRALIDYGFFEAHTTFGRIGVKVWIYKGDMTETEFTQKQAQQSQRQGRGRGGDRRGRGGRGGRRGGDRRNRNTQAQEGAQSRGDAPDTAKKEAPGVDASSHDAVAKEAPAAQAPVEQTGDAGAPVESSGTEA
ncbi:MAG: 30S ribosomal protein S3 [Actinomycetaceae bacterium]|nr:30S ribosomal protein S3 [Actinomycetaceae bacterium]